MNKMRAVIMVFLAAGISGVSYGRDFYVATNGASVFPYISWPDASTNIEWAVNAATNSDTVWISNGVYVLTNQVNVISNIAIRGFNANNRPVIDGNSNRCFNVTATATLANLFITRGYSLGPGGGVFMHRGTVSDCVFSNNVCSNDGGGLFLFTGLVQRCSFVVNRAWVRGGGVGVTNAGGKVVVDDCRFYTNFAINPSASSYGGGVSYAMLVTNCHIIGNVAGRAGGGVSYCSMVSHSYIISNICGVVGPDGEGGGGYMSSFTNCHLLYNRGIKGGAGSQGSYFNCIIASNSGESGGALYYMPGKIYDCVIDGNVGDVGGVRYFFGDMRNCLIKNNVGYERYVGLNTCGGVEITTTAGESMKISGCTIVSNYGAGSTGVGGLNVANGNNRLMVDNTIIYYNFVKSAGVYSNYFVAGTNRASFTNCCFSPALTSAVAVAMSVNNITNDPRFVNWQGGDFHLGGNSPCVNAGLNQPWMEGASDLEPGRKRIRYGTVDIGAYEKVHEATFYNFH